MIRENRPYDELKVGDSASIRRVCTANDPYIFAHASGNLNPLHLPDEELTVSVAVREKLGDGRVTFDTLVERGDGRKVAEGIAEVMAPTRKLRFDDSNVPELLVQRHRHFDRLLQACEGLDPIRTAVAVPEDKASLGGALLAAQHGLIHPVLVGAASTIAAVASEIGAELAGIELLDIPGDDAAAAACVDLVRVGKAEAIMKGHLHTDALLHHVLKHESSLRTTRRLSHAFVMAQTENLSRAAE
jgi:phosphate butyryltransferase